MNALSAAALNGTGNRSIRPLVPHVTSEAHLCALINQIAVLQRQVNELSHALVAKQASRPGSDLPGSKSTLIRNVIEARARRGNFLPPALFADPAWDMLLDLFLAHHSQLRVCVSSLCVASNVPATTALRWIKTLEDQQLIERKADPLDARRYFLMLSPAALDAMTAYFSTLSDPFA